VLKNLAWLFSYRSLKLGLFAVFPHFYCPTSKRQQKTWVSLNIVAFRTLSPLLGKVEDLKIRTSAPKTPIKSIFSLFTAPYHRKYLRYVYETFWANKKTFFLCIVSLSDLYSLYIIS